MRGFERGFTFVVGNMFGGKTSEMIHLLSREQHLGRKVQAFKMSWDSRYRQGNLIAHSGTSFPARQIKGSFQIPKYLERDTKVLGIEEVQFFDEGIIDYILENKDKLLIIATALQLDFRGNPFPLRGVMGMEYDSAKNVGDLMPYAKIISRYPQCTFLEGKETCREEAIYIQRFKESGELAPYNDPTIVVGGKDKYAPRCLEHFVKPERD